MDFTRLLHRGFGADVPVCRSLDLGYRGERHRSALFCGSIERADDPNVPPALFARRLGVPIMENTIRKMKELRRELIPLGKCPTTCLAVDDDRLFDRERIFVGLIQANDPFGTDDFLFGDIDRLEAACKTGHAVADRGLRLGTI